jgi:DNA polymerase III epsilon subunit-like protein
MSVIAFVDIETTGLDPDHHEIWEAAVVLYDTTTRAVTEEKVWQLPVDLGRADPVALSIGRFHERRRPSNALVQHRSFARHFAELTRGAHLAGAVVSFDEERLRRTLKANGACPEWHYHLIDVEALAVGCLAARGQGPMIPWRSDDLSYALGVEISDDDRHTALGDARWALRLYEAVTTPVQEMVSC